MYRASSIFYCIMYQDIDRFIERASEKMKFDQEIFFNDIIVCYPDHRSKP